MTQPQKDKLLQGIADGLRDLERGGSQASLYALAVTYYDADEDVLVRLPVGMALDYLVNEVTRDNESDWSDAVRAEVGTL